MRRGVLVILLVTVLAVTAVTVLLQPARVQRSGPWRSVPLKLDDVHRLDALWNHQVLVGGRGAGGGPLLAVVDRGEVLRLDVPGDGGVWSQVVTSDVSVVVDDEGSQSGPSGSVVGVPGSGDDWTVIDEYEPMDRDGRRPDRLWLTEEDEGAAAVGGFLDEEGHLALVPLDWAGATFVEGPPGLYLAADASPADLWVGGTEGSYVVAGPVSDTPGATDTGVQVWTTATMDEFHWTRVELDPPPDVVTDMRGWVLDLYLAGPVDQRPLVLGAHGGWTLEVPDVALDPADPTVLLAEIPFDTDERASVVLQTPDGAVLYRATDEGWDEVALPPGRAEAAVLTWDDLDGPRTAYAVVDGTLWWRALPAPGS